MATQDQLKSLVKSHADGDDPQCYAVAMQVASKAARAGQARFAQELRDMVRSIVFAEVSECRRASLGHTGRDAHGRTQRATGRFLSRCSPLRPRTYQDSFLDASACSAGATPTGPARQARAGVRPQAPSDRSACNREYVNDAGRR